MVGNVEINEDSLLLPLPQQIEEVGLAEVLLPDDVEADLAPACGSAGPANLAVSGKTELSDLESAALLPDEQQALQL